MATPPEFSIEVHQNPYIPVGGHEVHAVVHVTATGTPTGAASGARAAEVIMVDTSGSMAGAQIQSAREATKAAIDTLRDGTLFAVIAGTGSASVVYPFENRLVAVDERTRKEARRAVDKLTASGGTAMGQWLTAARRLFEPHPDLIRHAILLTDGMNGESPHVLQKAIDQCEGVFVCDGRGIGVNWQVDEVRRITSALLGDLGLVAEPSKLVEDFTGMMERAMGKAIADVGLRVRTTHNARVKYVKQIYPVIEDLTGRRVETAPNAGDYPTGSWGAESKHYHVCLDVAPDESDPHGRRRPCLISAVVSDPSGGPAVELAKAGVFAEWTDDEELSTRLSPEVAQATGRVELAVAVREGLQARREGDEAFATARLARALELADEAGDEHTARLLRRVVDVDEETGTAVLCGRASLEDEMSLDIESHKTARL